MENGYFFDGMLTQSEKDYHYNSCIGCLNRICVSDDKEEILTMIASLQRNAVILAKNNFRRIDNEITNQLEERQ